MVGRPHDAGGPGVGQHGLRVHAVAPVGHSADAILSCSGRFPSVLEVCIRHRHSFGPACPECGEAVEPGRYRARWLVVGIASRLRWARYLLLVLWLVGGIGLYSRLAPESVFWRRVSALQQFPGFQSRSVIGLSFESGAAIFTCKLESASDRLIAVGLPPARSGRDGLRLQVVTIGTGGPFATSYEGSTWVYTELSPAQTESVFRDRTIPTALIDKLIAESYRVGWMPVTPYVQVSGSVTTATTPPDTTAVDPTPYFDDGGTRTR